MMHRPVETAEVPEVQAIASRKSARFALRSYHVAAVLFVAVVGGLLLYAFYPTLTGKAGEDERPEVARAEATPAQVQTITVAPRDFILRAEATGYLTPWRVVDVSAEVGGRVVERRVEEGQFVPEDAILLRMDDRDRRIELQEAESDLLNARAVYAVNMSPGEIGAVDTTGLSAARDALAQAERRFERGEISRETVDQVRRTYEARLALSGRDRGSLQAISAGLVQAEQRLERARLALSRTEVRAPFAGRIADLEFETGQQVGGGQTLLSLVEDARMKVEVDVLESDLVHVRQGGAAIVRVPSLGDAAFQGTVHSINPRVDNRSGTGRVTVAVSNPRGMLYSGLFAYVDLETGRLPDRIVVPAEAVLVRQGRDLVFRIQNDRAMWVYVTVGRRSGDEVEIEDGLSAGDEVAVSGHFALAHDAPVDVTGR